MPLTLRSFVYSVHWYVKSFVNLVTQDPMRTLHLAYYVTEFRNSVLRLFF